MTEIAAVPLPPPSASADEARRQAEEILSRPEFRRPGPSLIERVQRWMAQRLADLFGALGGSGLGTVLSWMILVAATVAIVLLIRRALTGSRLPAAEAKDSTPEATTVIDHTVTPDQWRAEADSHAAAGRWRDALRCRYRALVGDLARRSLLDEIPGRTTGEERRELVESAPRAADRFIEATELFDDAWYGQRTATADDHQHFAVLEAEVLASAPARSPRAVSSVTLDDAADLEASSGTER